MKTYKLKQDYKGNIGNLKKGTLFVEFCGYFIQSATPTDKVNYHCFSIFSELKRSDLLEEVDISKEKWAHPHLLKQHKERLSQLLVK